jgi:hypothetical protein
MKYEARLARLEALVGKGAGNCPYCRLHMRHSWPDPDKPTPKPQAPALAVYPECPMCGGKARLDLSEYADGERELRRIFFAAKLEDFYRDERAWAAKRWVSEYDAALDARAKQQGGEPPYVGVTYRRPKQKESPEKKLYDKLRSDYFAHVRRVRGRLEAQHGKDPFPELAARLAAVTHDDRAHLYKGEPFGGRVPIWEMLQLQRGEAAWLRCAQLERHVLGGVIASTQERIDDCERRALEMIEEARRRHEETVESERLRREEAERARREREEREQAFTPPAPATAAPQDESIDAAVERFQKKLAMLSPPAGPPDRYGTTDEPRRRWQRRAKY